MWLLAVGAGLVVLAVACSTTPDDAVVDQSEIWDNPTTFVDPDGVFQLDFPAEPQAKTEVHESFGVETITHTVEAAAGNWNFELIWSEAPAGSPLLSQTIPENFADSFAESDGGTLIFEEPLTVSGRRAVVFAVELPGGGFYWDQVMRVGGRLYEIWVQQPVESREEFDEFVASFKFLEPPLAPEADFFGEANHLCGELLDSYELPPEDATPSQRAAMMRHISDERVRLADDLGSVPVLEAEQANAVAMIDALRRNSGPGYEFADAVELEEPDLEPFAVGARGDMDLVHTIAKEHGAERCERI